MIDDCPRDPNLKTKGEPEEDYQRLFKLKDYRKLFADTVITTTHLLKKCISVPKVVL